MHKFENIKSVRFNEYSSNFNKEDMSSPLSNSQNKNPKPEHFDDDRTPLRPAVLNDNAPVLISLVIIIPVIFVILLCLLTFCIYRWRKRRNERQTRSSSIVTIYQENNDLSSLSYKNLHDTTDLPPSYSKISKTKENLQPITYNNDTIKEYPQSGIKNETTFTSTSNNSYPINTVP
ncbi:hypothetical protein I4U23_018517 [Adineta vaga]|nr:hypothetical protein I4U23_018517 [Adineta vaga]